MHSWRIRVEWFPFMFTCVIIIVFCFTDWLVIGSQTAQSPPHYLRSPPPPPPPSPPPPPPPLLPLPSSTPSRNQPVSLPLTEGWQLHSSLYVYRRHVYAHPLCIRWYARTSPPSVAHTPQRTACSALSHLTHLKRIRRPSRERGGKASATEKAIRLVPSVCGVTRSPCSRRRRSKRFARRFVVMITVTTVAAVIVKGARWEKGSNRRNMNEWYLAVGKAPAGGITVRRWTADSMRMAPKGRDQEDFTPFLLLQRLRRRRGKRLKTLRTETPPLYKKKTKRGRATPRIGQSNQQPPGKTVRRRTRRGREEEIWPGRLSEEA